MPTCENPGPSCLQPEVISRAPCDYSYWLYSALDQIHCLLISCLFSFNSSDMTPPSLLIDLAHRQGRTVFWVSPKVVRQLNVAIFVWLLYDFVWLYYMTLYDYYNWSILFYLLYWLCWVRLRHTSFSYFPFSAGLPSIALQAPALQSWGPPELDLIYMPWITHNVFTSLDLLSLPLNSEILSFSKLLQQQVPHIFYSSLFFWIFTLVLSLCSLCTLFLLKNPPFITARAEGAARGCHYPHNLFLAGL